MDANLFFCGDSDRRVFHKDRYVFAKDILATSNNQPLVIDAACGTGYGTRVISDALDIQVIGLDIDQGAVTYAQRTYSDHKTSFICGNILDRDSFPPGSVGALVSFETIEHVSDPIRFLENVCYWLQDDGMLLISTPNEWGFTRYHLFDYTYDLFRDHVERYFQISRIYVQNSGSKSVSVNRGMPRQLVEATAENISTAECFVAACVKKGR